MKSRLTIEMDFESKEPYIHIHLNKTDDVRDKVLKYFVESLSTKKIKPLFIDNNNIQLTLE